jgi:hypothetical protein
LKKQKQKHGNIEKNMETLKKHGNIGKTKHGDNNKNIDFRVVMWRRVKVDKGEDMARRLLS